MRQGRLPHNTEIDSFLERLINSPSIHSRQHLMSPDGKRLLRDFQELVTTIRKAVAVKNKNELFQSFVYHLHAMDNPVTKGKYIIQNTNQVSLLLTTSVLSGANATIRIAKLVLLNGEFRDVLNELIAIVQEVFGDAANKASESLQQAGNNLNSQAQHLGDRAQEMADPDRQNRYKNNLKQQTSQKGRQYQQQALEQARLHHERSKQYARDKFPPEKVDDIIRRLKVVLAEVQRNPDYQYAINTILRLFSTWSHRAMDMSQETAKTTAGTGQTFRSDKNWSQAEQEIKTIIEAWAQGKSLDHLVHSVRDIISDIKNDPALRKYYDEVIFYIHRLLKEPAYVVEDRSTEDGRALIETGRNFTQHRYRNHTNALMDEIRSYTRAMAKDPISMELHLRTKAIHQDLWFDEQGNPAFKPQLINDMRLTLLPALFEQIKYVPIPRIEYSDKQFDVVVENVILAGDTLLPNFFDVKLESYSKFSPSEDTKDTGRQSVFIKMSEIQAVIEDVVFSYNKKSGFPKLSDRGIAALEIGGKGIDVSLKLTSTNDPKHMYKVNSCRCRIDNLKVTVKDSNHDLMYKAMHPMVIGIVRKQIARAIENKIIELLELGD
ncbi:hypothetical protein PHYBLDRAFT_107123, partial [Phycomyces blakesleeanus NRRL 1555(-)]